MSPFGQLDLPFRRQLTGATSTPLSFLTADAAQFPLKRALSDRHFDEVSRTPVRSQRDSNLPVRAVADSPRVSRRALPLVGSYWAVSSLACRSVRLFCSPCQSTFFMFVFDGDKFTFPFPCFRGQIPLFPFFFVRVTWSSSLFSCLQEELTDSVVSEFMDGFPLSSPSVDS